MGIDRFWLCPTLNRETWVERRDPAFSSSLYKFGVFEVYVSAGENLCIDELYNFLSTDDAIKFYLEDVAFREFDRPDSWGFGFQEISTYVNDRKIATRNQLGSNPSSSHPSSNQGNSSEIELLKGMAEVALRLPPFGERGTVATVF